ncbi:phosphotriesterase [Pseudooceanicola nanhaiensis]|uniref:phosphotriesterase family protein n=1 Tax=Pseudooceanicola nanhaiensis TaxID=375761 RepID=UPI001CD38427|nr:hypothetical protein [Pseudooceanicola nanhaiensis]MCA0920101.1 hypothetical protein [Pseudooceanicola nanhaiensis]
MPHPDHATLQGKIQTVTGLIAPEDLGLTLMHEHLLWDLRALDDRGPEAATGPELSLATYWDQHTFRPRTNGNMMQRDVDVAIEEVGHFTRAGGSAIVEVTIGDIGPDPEGLVKIARATGAQIVMGCGHYVQRYQDPTNATRDIDSFAAEMVGNIREGTWGTDVRAGILGEIGCGEPWTEQEKRVLAGAAVAQQETGAALTIHPSRHGATPLEILAHAVAHGADPTRVIMDHMERTLFDLDDFQRLAETGCVLEFDLFGWETAYYNGLSDIDLPNDGGRVRIIRELIAHGHGDQIVLSHDVCMKTRMRRYGGPGYGHIPERVVPLMLRRGITQAQIDAMLIHTPRRLLTIV